MAAEMDRRSFLRTAPGGLAIAGMAAATVGGVVGTGAAAVLGASEAMAAPRSIGTLKIPKIRLSTTIYAGIGNDALNTGVGHGSWSSTPGGSGHTQLFGHRTSHGGRFRNLHKLRKGDSIVVGATTYTVRKIEVISVADKKRIWAYDGAGPRLSLVACSKANGLPTSLQYRICVRATA